MDGSTLQQTFDLVVLGTGHAESIVAAAAARAGKAVLHVDASGHYGGAHAALSLRQFEELAFPPTVDPSDATPARAPLGVAALLHARNDGLEFVGEPCRLPDSLRSVASRFTIDVVPSLILSVGRSVDAMRGSGAASYAEFKSLDSAWVIDAAPSPSADSDDGTAEPLWAFQKVPSSKADVFAAPFGLLEKRQLMKFLQFALEHAASGDGTAVTRLNEATLGAGRSLKR